MENDLRKYLKLNDLHNEWHFTLSTESRSYASWLR